MAKTVDYYFDYASPYAYAADIMLRQWQDASVNYIPLYLRGFERFAAGIPFSPAQLRYIARDIKRITQHLGAPLQYPSVFPINGLYGLRGALVAKQRGEFSTYHPKMFAAAWADNKNIGDKNAMLDLVASWGLDRQAYAEGIESDAIKTELKQNVETGKTAGLFGVPSFVVEGELFWGQDRLDFVKRAMLR